MADETKQHTMLTAQPSHRNVCCWEPEVLPPGLVTSAIRNSCRGEAKEQSNGRIALGFCGSFELVSIELFSHFILQSAKPE